MTSRRRTFLQIPQGTEAIYLEEAYRHRRIIARLDELFESWGYLPVHTPVFDFFDNYRALLSDSALDNVYRLIDREGDLLMLRSDITLFLAKQMGLALSKEELPVRVYYSDVILRHQDREDISRNEFFQAGVELIGKGGKESDLEVLVLLLRTLSTLGVSAVVHVGSRALFDRFFQEIDDDGRRRLAAAIAVRDAKSIAKVVERWDASLVDFAERLFGFIGDADGLDRLRAEGRKISGVPDGVIAEIKRMVELSRVLEATGEGSNHRIDTSEIGTQPYYTGIVFQAYVHGQDSAIASGGRYDRLLESFGFPAPSIGFSLLLRKVEPLMEAREEIPKAVRADGQSFLERLQAADALRRKGKIALL